MIQLPILLAAIGLLVWGDPARGETITGTFRYADFNAADNSTIPLPIQFCRVEIHAYRPRPPLGLWTWGLEAETTTDAAGSISVSMPFQGPGVQYSLSVFAQNYAAVVLPNQLLASGPFFEQPGFPGAPVIRTVSLPSDVLNFSYDFTDWYAPQHWSLADAVRRGFDYVSARRDPTESDVLPFALVHPGYPGNTFYNPVTETIEINNSLVWEDFTVLHEYGHFVEHHLGIFAVIASVHDGCAASVLGVNINSAEQAWMEGFAEFFAQVVARKSPPGTLRGHPGDFGTFSVPDLENTPWDRCTGLPANVTPGMIENVVAGVLWDVFDAEGICFSSETHDALAGFDTEVIQILDRELDMLSHAPGIDDFSAAWIARGLPAEPFRDILRHHGLAPPLPPPSFLTPPDITVTASATSCTAMVTFPKPVLDQNRRCAVVFCDPPSGSAFPIGTTTVSCRALENGPVLAMCSFNVTVQPNPSLPNPGGTGLLGVYYDDLDFTAPRVARAEAVNFDWGLGAPAPGVDASTFSVRWAGKLVPRYSDRYRIITVSDDGVRLWIDGLQIVGEWNPHSPTEHYGDIFLQAGRAYDVGLEMYNASGGAVAQLLWQSVCQPKEPIPASHLLPARLDPPEPDPPPIPVNFVPIAGLFNTGVDATGLPLAEDESDTHYLMRPSIGRNTVPFATTSADGFPVGPWLPDNTSSAWIAPTISTLAAPEVDIQYETTFNLNGLSTAGAVIRGWVAVDNQLVDILINGQSTGQSTPFAALGGDPFTSWQAFAILSGIQAGTNTLTFVTRNGTGGSNPTGVRVEMRGWTTLAPLSFADWAAGFGLSGGAAADGADPDGDGMGNGPEYISGGNPTRPGTAGSPVATVVGGNLVFVFPRADASETPDVTLTVETGTDLVTWPTVFNIRSNTATSTAGVTVAENGSAADTITVTIALGPATRLFARLKVRITP